MSNDDLAIRQANIGLQGARKLQSKMMNIPFHSLSPPVHGEYLEYGSLNNPRNHSPAYIPPIHGENLEFDALGRHIRPVNDMFFKPTIQANIPSSILPPPSSPVSPIGTDLGPGGSADWGPGAGWGPSVNNGIGPTSTDLGPGYGPYDVAGCGPFNAQPPLMAPEMYSFG